MTVHAVDAQMDRALLRRVQGEYNEMPGLRLTLEQACRLWNTDMDTGAQVLDVLVNGAFLRRVGVSYVRADAGV